MIDQRDAGLGALTLSGRRSFLTRITWHNSSKSFPFLIFYKKKKGCPNLQNDKERETTNIQPEKYIENKTKKDRKTDRQ